MMVSKRGVTKLVSLKQLRLCSELDFLQVALCIKPCATSLLPSESRHYTWGYLGKSETI